MYSISICDSEERTRDSLERMVDCYFKAKNIPSIIRKFNDLREMSRFSGWVDIVFLDASTVASEGFVSVRALVKENPKMYLYILGDRYTYLDDAMDMHAFRYMVKPIDLDRLYLSLGIILDSPKEINFMSNYLPVTLKEDEIVCVYSYERKTFVLTDTGVKYPTIMSIKAWKRKLEDSEDFSQPHYSYIINMNFISSFDGKQIILNCKNGKKINITPSQRKLSEFRSGFYARNRQH